MDEEEKPVQTLIYRTQPCLVNLGVNAYCRVRVGGSDDVTAPLCLTLTILSDLQTKPRQSPVLRSTPQKMNSTPHPPSPVASSTIHPTSHQQHESTTEYTNTRHRHSHLYLIYTPIPIFAAIVWFATLLAMLLTWLISGRPHYVSMSDNQRIAYISDVGADKLKPLFITGCAITGIGFCISLAVERWLRHEGRCDNWNYLLWVIFLWPWNSEFFRLLPNTRTREKVFSSLAILGSFIGAVALILLSVFDTKRYTVAHRVFLLFFVLGVALSAIFTVIEVRWFLVFDRINWLLLLQYKLLTRTYDISRNTRYPPSTIRALKASYILKAALTVILVILAIAFGALIGSDSGSRQDVAAVIEWSIAFGFTIYVLSFGWDLAMSRGVRRGEYKETMRDLRGDVSLAQRV